MTPRGLGKTLKRPRISGSRTVITALLAATSLLSACSGIKTYETSVAKNLQVRTATDAGSWFSSIRTAVDIHRVGKGCATDYEGTVQLNEPTTNIGLPPDRWTHLVFVFASFSFLANKSGTTTYETLLKPRPNYRYHAEVSYRNDMYHVAIREFPPNQSIGRELDSIPLSSCRERSAQK